MAGNSMQPEDTPELRALYEGFEANHLKPLWTQRGNLMPAHPAPKAVPHVWKWSSLLPLAQASGDLVPVGRGGERRAIGLANPGLEPHAYISPTLWAAVQYLGPKENAPEHRHSQNAFRFVLDGEGVWTVVDGDPVRMSRGDLLLTPGWQFHGHHNESEDPMVWLDGLDIPFGQQMDVGFFEFGADKVSTETPHVSRSERLWAYPGLRPLSHLGAEMASPLAAFRWEHTDRALSEQLLLETENATHGGRPPTVEPGHAAVCYTNPTTGGDVMQTIRCEFHRLREGTETKTKRYVGSRAFQVFDGRGAVVLNGERKTLETGDIFVVPSWIPWSLQAETRLDLFCFSDAPIMEKLGFMRHAVE